MRNYELFAELASENRLSILHALKEKPLKFTRLTSEINATSPETSRQLKRLTDSYFIRKDVDGYYSLTPLGELTISSIPNLKAIAERSDFFLNHDTSPIPDNLLKRLDSLSKGEIIRGVFVLVNKVETLFEETQEFSWYLSDDFPKFYLPKIENKLDSGVQYRVIYPRDFLEQLLADISPKIRHCIKMRVLDKVNVAINVNDNFCFVALPGFDGNIDRDSVIIGYDDDFKDWCKEVFDYYWEKATPYYP